MGKKVKYDYAFKLECVKLVLESDYSAEAVSKQKGLNESNIRKWVGFYKTQGERGLLPRKNRSYSTVFKLKVVQSIDKEFLSLRDACFKFNIPDAGIIVK
ncbi:MAG: Uncharacterised protein [Formosa sp. Hel1_33_131]|nr:MAG: Uncharacterised protein [Formosa sp. Hel1_33_131]